MVLPEPHEREFLRCPQAKCKIPILHSKLLGSKVKYLTLSRLFAVLTRVSFATLAAPLRFGSLSVCAASFLTEVDSEDSAETLAVDPVAGEHFANEINCAS
jgi:hypothetical protein